MIIFEYQMNLIIPEWERMKNMRILFIGSDNMDACFAPLQYDDLECAFFNGYEEEQIPKHCSRIYSDLQEAIKQFRPDLAIIGVPNYRKNRPEYEELVMQQNIPLLIQKFRLRKFEDFHRVVECQRRTGSNVYIGEFYRLAPSITTSKALLLEGKIGALEYIRWQAGINGEVCPWESSYDELAIQDLAFHHFSAIQFLMGLGIDSIYACSRSPKKGGVAKGTLVSAVLQMQNGIVLEYTVDWHCSLLNTDFFGTVYLEGEEGGIEIQQGKVFLEKWGQPKQEIPLIFPPYPTGLQQLVAFFHGDTNEAPIILEEFFPVMETLEGMLKSSHTGQVIFETKKKG